MAVHHDVNQVSIIVETRNRKHNTGIRRIFLERYFRAVCVSSLELLMSIVTNSSGES